MSNLVPPHGGGVLKPLLIPEADRAGERKRAAGLTAVPMTSRENSDLVMLAMGAYTPLEGFMGEADWRGVCADMQLANGVFWPIPITLSATTELADGIKIGDEVALVDAETDEIMGILTVGEKYAIDKAFECANVFRTEDAAHPGVANAAAIAAQHEKWGERPVLIVVRAEGADVSEGELLAFYDGKVASWQVPDAVIFVEDLPIGATGKVLKIQLREQFGGYLVEKGA